jgi:hypothetical protein
MMRTRSIANGGREIFEMSFDENKNLEGREREKKALMRKHDTSRHPKNISTAERNFVIYTHIHE